MKKIEQIRENYDLITEKDESDTRKLTSLVRAGLFDQSKLPLLKRALQKDPSKLTMAERKALLDLLDSLMSEVLHSNQVYSKVKQSVMSDKDLHEEVGSLVSPIDGKQSRPLSSKIDLPYMLIMKRKAVRVYPGNERVGLYYIQALDRYITVPFGPGVSNMNEGVDWQGAAKSVDSYSGSLRNRVFGKPASGNPSKFKKYAETNPERVSRKYYSNPDNAEHKELAKKAQGTLSGQHWSIRAGFAAGQALRGAIGAHTSKDNAPEAPKKVSAPRSQGPWGERPTQTTPKVTQKPAKVSAPTSAPKVSTPKMASTSGSATGSFGGSMSAPMTAKASAPKTPKAAKPSREEKRIAKLPGMGAQPKTGDFPQADKKVKTFSTNTQLTQARDLTPLEKKTGTVNPEKQLPRKRYAGIDPKVPGTGPQPSVGKLKAPGKRMMAKLEEQRQLREAEKEKSGWETAADIVTDIIPGISNAKSAASAYRNIKAGNYVKGAVDAALAVPGVGNAAKFVGAGVKAVKAGVKLSKKADKPLEGEIISPPKKAPEAPTKKTPETIEGNPKELPAPPKAIEAPKAPEPPKVPEAPKAPAAPKKTPDTRPDSIRYGKGPKPGSSKPETFKPEEGSFGASMAKAKEKMDTKTSVKEPSSDIHFDMPSNNLPATVKAPQKVSAPEVPAPKVNLPSVTVKAPETPNLPSVKSPATTTEPVSVPAPLPVTTPSVKTPTKVDTKTPTSTETKTQTKTPTSTETKTQVKAPAPPKTPVPPKTPKPPRKGFRLPIPPLGGGSDTETKPLTPGPFKLKANLVEPKGDVQTGFNKRAENDYRKSLKMSEDANSAPTISRSSPVSFKMSTKLISPGRKSVVTGYDKKAENDYRNSLREDVFTSLKTMINNNVTEMQLNIGENTIKINNTIATKIVNVHETLNEDNQKKMRDMLNEGDVSSFKKILDFAVRQ